MAWEDLHEGILGEFVESGAMVQLPLAFEDGGHGYMSPRATWLAGTRRGKRRTTPVWNKGLVLVAPEEARARRNERRRARYAANAEVERAKGRKRMRRWLKKHRKTPGWVLRWREARAAAAAAKEAA